MSVVWTFWKRWEEYSGPFSECNVSCTTYETESLQLFHKSSIMNVSNPCKAGRDPGCSSTFGLDRGIFRGFLVFLLGLGAKFSHGRFISMALGESHAQGKSRRCRAVHSGTCRRLDQLFTERLQSLGCTQMAWWKRRVDLEVWILMTWSWEGRGCCLVENV